METLLQDITNVKVYLDDILITGPTEKTHLQTLETVLDRLGKAGLRLQRQKCILMAPQWSIWGTGLMSRGCIQQRKKSERCRRPQSHVMWLS